MSYDLVEGDTSPALIVTCTVGGAAVDLEDLALSAVLRVQYPDGTAGDLTLAAEDLAVGTWVHEWSSGETDIVGVHLAQIVVQLVGDLQATYPSDGTFVRWRVNERLP